MPGGDVRELLEAQGVYLRALAVAVARVAPEITAAPLLGLWLAFEGAQRDGLASWRDYKQRWRDHVGPFFGELDASAVGPSDCDRYRAARLAAGAAIATVNREIALLRRLVNFGVRRGTVAKSKLHGPGMTRDLIHREDNVRLVIVEEHGTAMTIEVFLDAAPPMLRAFIILVFHSGMRRREASLIRWDRIDWRAGLVWIPDVDTKGKRCGRDVPLSSEAIAALEQLPRTSPWVFGNAKTGHAYHPDYWTHAFRKLCVRLGLSGPDGPPWLHDLRRSFITLSRRRGEPESDIMQVSGHKTRSVFDRYNAQSTRDVIAFRSRAELARAELAEIRTERKPPQRVGHDAETFRSEVATKA